MLISLAIGLADISIEKEYNPLEKDTNSSVFVLNAPVLKLPNTVP